MRKMKKKKLANLGLAEQLDGEVSERVQEAVDEDAHDDLAYVVVELLLLVVDGLGHGGGRGGRVQAIVEHARR